MLDLNFKHKLHYKRLIWLLTLTFCCLLASASAARLCCNSTGKLSSSLTENQTQAQPSLVSKKITVHYKSLHAPTDRSARIKVHFQRNFSLLWLHHLLHWIIVNISWSRWQQDRTVKIFDIYQLIPYSGYSPYCHFIKDFTFACLSRDKSTSLLFTWQNVPLCRGKNPSQKHFYHFVL